MYNEVLFIIQNSFVISVLLYATHLGKSALCSSITVLWVLTNLFVAKEIVLCGFHATAADVYAIGGTVGLNLLQEYYGIDAARKAIKTNFLLMALYAIGAYLHCSFIPSTQDWSQLHYAALLLPMPRILCASIISYYISQHTDTRIYGMLRKNGMHASAATTVSVCISQFIDTIIFTIIGLYGIIAHPMSVCGISYSIKLASILCSISLLSLSRLFILPTKIHV